MFFFKGIFSASSEKGLSQGVRTSAAADQTTLTVPRTVCCRVVPHSLGPKGKWSAPFSSHSYSFHPTVLREKAWSSAQRPAVSGSRGQSWPAKRSPSPHPVSNQAHSTPRWPPTPPLSPVAWPQSAWAAWDQTQAGGTSGPVLSAWMSHDINTQG